MEAYISYLRKPAQMSPLLVGNSYIVYNSAAVMEIYKLISLSTFYLLESRQTFPTLSLSLVFLEPLVATSPDSHL
jgi:hypothetical protein